MTHDRTACTCALGDGAYCIPHGNVCRPGNQHVFLFPPSVGDRCLCGDVEYRPRWTPSMAGLLKINLACGTDVREFPWVNLDVVKQWPSAWKPCDILWDARTDPLPFGNECADEIYAGYLFLHLAPRFHEAVLKDIRRVLHPDGIFRVTEVDMALAMPQWLADPTYPSLSNLIWGEQGQGIPDPTPYEPFDKHCQGFTERSLTTLLKDAGFAGIHRTRVHGPETWYELTLECRLDPTWRPGLTKVQRARMDLLDRVGFQILHATGTICNIGCSDDPVGFPGATQVDLDHYDIPNFVQSDCTSMPFGDKQFDTAVLGDVLEHVLDPEAAVREAARIARKLVITLPEELRLPSVGQHIALGVRMKADSIREAYPDLDPTLPDDDLIEAHKKTLDKFVRSTKSNSEVPHDGHINRFDADWVQRLINASGMKVTVRETRQGGFDAEGVYQWQGWLLVLED